LNITSCRFERATTRGEHEPRAAGPDVVFIGRSNVGKSSLINSLLGTDALARTSSQPGRTQTVNFYRVNESFWFVDLPGYGYAKAPEAVRRAWKPMVEGYLDRRRSRIAVAVLVLDARREPTSTDEAMRDWLEARTLPYVAAVTKSDKLSGNALARAERLLDRAFGPGALGGSAVIVSARTGRGVRELWRRLEPALTAWRGTRARDESKLRA
jgi:GTP-binding protein